MAIKKLELAKTLRPFTGQNGVYVSLTPSLKTQRELYHLSNLVFEGFTRPVRIKLPDEYHLTVMWSKVCPADPGLSPGKVYLATLDRLDYWVGHDNDGYLGAVLKSPAIQSLHQSWTDRGAEHSFPDLKIHVTLADKFRPTAELLRKIKGLSKRYAGTSLMFGNETREDLKH